MEANMYIACFESSKPVFGSTSAIIIIVKTDCSKFRIIWILQLHMYSSVIIVLLFLTLKQANGSISHTLTTLSNNVTIVPAV